MSQPSLLPGASTFWNTFRRVLPLLAFVLILFAFQTNGWAQDEHAAEAAKPEQPSVLELIMHGGPLIITVWIAILVTSMIMVTLVIQNSLTLRRAKLAPPDLVQTLEASLADGNYQESWEVCRTNKSYLTNVLKGSLERIGRGHEAFENTLLNLASSEANSLKTRNAYLSVIGVVAPMIGLLGTVIGMMKAFATLAESGISDPRKLANNISEVLLATATGLFIAIPAFIFYYVFRNAAQAAILHSDAILSRMVEDIPFSELEGVKIGENYSPVQRNKSKEKTRSARVSAELTTSCPVCSSPIKAGETPCPSCGAKLDWG